MNLVRELAPESGATAAGTDPVLEVMLAAIDSPRGVAIDVDSEASGHSWRMRIYRRRQKAQAEHNKHFDGLVVRIVRQPEGSPSPYAVEIIPTAPVQQLLREL